MDFLEFVCAMTIILTAGFLIFIHIYARNALKMEEYAEKRRKSELASKAAHARHEQPDSDLGEWVPELLGSLGVSPEVLFQDEIPPELSKMLPLVKGFLQSGGLQKLLGGAGAAPDERSSI